MKRNEILQHFPNGCTVKCLVHSVYSVFYHQELTIRNDKWCFHDADKGLYIILEHNGQLAEIVTNDVVYAQLGKEVKAILDKESNYAVIGEKVSRLYER